MQGFVFFSKPFASQAPVQSPAAQKICAKAAMTTEKQRGTKRPLVSERREWSDNELLNRLIGDGNPSTGEVAVRLTQVPQMKLYMGLLLALLAMCV